MGKGGRYMATVLMVMGLEKRHILFRFPKEIKL